MDTGTTNLLWAETLADALVRNGLSRVVISPGSRSTPLTLACERHPAIQTFIQVDERCAAFFALGMARATSQPVALICTSGSALGHWHPAVIEASHSGVPLLLLSADRPAELQGVGANQTIAQDEFFGSAVRAYYALPEADASPAMLAYLQALATRAMQQCRWPHPGPVHINIPLREPLLPAVLPPPPVSVGSSQTTPLPLIQPEPEQLQRLATTMGTRPGLIICGPGHFSPAFATSLMALAQRLDAPVLADPLSGLRFGPHMSEMMLTRYDAFLRNSEFCQDHRPEWVLRFGAMPVSKPLLQFLGGLEATPLYVVDPHGAWPDPLHCATEMVRATPELLCENLAAWVEPASSSWRKAFCAEEQRCAKLAENAEVMEGAVIRELLSQLPEGSTLFSSNSMAIRDIDTFSGCSRKALGIVGNRGASGIDGNVSTLLGLAAAHQGEGKVVGLLGDLALYHDMNGLLAARGLEATLIVVNNGGGAIFHYLPQAGLEEFERAWLTPTGIDIAQVAALYNLSHWRLEEGEGFGTALAEALATPGVKLIEIMIDARKSVNLHRQYWQAAATS